MMGPCGAGKEALSSRTSTDMTSHVHSFDPREGGSFRISLTYDTATGAGNITAHTDTHHGRFVKLVPNELVEIEQGGPDGLPPTGRSMVM